MRRFIGVSALALVTLVLAACGTRSSAPPAVQQTEPASPLDGVWKGEGTAPDGKQFSVSFIIQKQALASVIYAYQAPDGATCNSVELGQLTADQRPLISNDTIAVTTAGDFAFNASFKDAGEASGHMIVHRHDRLPRCNGDFEITWSARRVSLADTPAPGGARPAQSPLLVFLQLLVFGLSNGSVLALNAIGVTIIYSTVRILNLAHGDVFALTTALVTSMINAAGIQRGWPPLLLGGVLLIVLVAAVLMAGLLSLGVDQLAFRPFRGASRLAPLIATLGLSFILFQAALVWRTFQRSWIPGEHRSVPGLPEVPTDGIPPLLPEINLAAKLGIPNLVIRFSDLLVLLLAVVFVILATWFLRRTRTGRAIEALAQNPSLAAMIGVDIGSTIRRAFAVGGGFAGAAAFIFALYYGRPFGVHGAQSGLLAFAAALLGGMGSPLGALVSGLTIGVFSSMSDYYLSAPWTPVLLLALLVLTLAWRPAGLSGGAADLAAPADSVIVSRTSSSGQSRRWLAALLLPLGAFPLLAAAFGWSGQTILRTAEVYMLLALGLNVALGMGGLLDFGFAAGFGLGAYAGAILSGYDASIALLLGAGLGGALGLVKGLLARPLRGDFLAIATLALGLLMRQVIINLDSLTGGASGLSGFGAFHLLGMQLASPAARFYLIFAFLVLGTIAAHRLLDSRTGRAWLASREDEMAASASGVDVHRARMVALVVSSAMAGLAGALYAGSLPYVDPETMSFHTTTLVLTMVILGGAGNIPGAILGAAAIILYDKVLVPQAADWLALIWPRGMDIGSAPDIRGASFFNFGIALYLTVLLRARRRK